MQLDVLDKYDAEAEEARKKLKGDANGEAGFKVSKQAPKNPRKYTKKAINEEVSVETMGKPSSSAMETGQQAENAAEVVKPKGRAGSRKAPAKKQEKPSPSSDEDDEIESLKDRLKAYRLDSSPEQSADMETDVLRVPAGRNAARKKPLAAVSVISDSEDEPDLDDDFDVQVKAVPETKKKGGRKAAAANDKAAKPPAATKRRGPVSKQSQGLGQQLLTEMLKPAEESGISPEKKVRKMRASPFNKKSGSLLGGIETMPASSTSENADVIDVPAKARPQRANRKQTRYVLSDSESEDSDFEQASEDSDSD
ncbi:PREDICTED: DNA topoisomerase 2-like [Populus euphratica]|uniref:DNA topoisomerase 2-like n=1 Tax=Populus euphratica TaxID=75702 RepID=A0AAJ6VGI0_POPEU|nr:PREDICTED: DNA topoisomerase 2-like [Populus euphratica]